MACDCGTPRTFLLPFLLHVCCFAFSIGVIDRRCSVIVTLPGYHPYYLFMKRKVLENSSSGLETYFNKLTT